MRRKQTIQNLFVSDLINKQLLYFILRSRVCLDILGIDVIDIKYQLICNTFKVNKTRKETLTM